MFCKNCGAQLPDGAAFCGSCGTSMADNTPVAEANENVQPIVEAPVVQPVAETFENAQPQAVSSETVQPTAETPAATQPVENPAAPAQNNFTSYNNEPEKPAKKKSSPLKKIIPAAIALILVLAIVLNFSAISGFAIKTFGSSSAYMKYVENQAFSDYSETLTDTYGNIVERFDFNNLSNVEIGFVVGDEVEKMLKNQLGGEVDWLNDIVISLEGNTKDALNQYIVGLNVADQRILSLDMILDMGKYELLMALSELNDKYLKVDMSQFVKEYEEMAAAQEKMFEDIKGLTDKMLPDPAVLDKIICKYAKIALDNIDNVSKSNETLEIEGISQKLTVLKYTITPKDLLEMAKDILKEAKADKDIKKVVEDFANAITEYGLDEGYEFDNLYKDLQELIDMALEEVEDTIDASIPDQELCTMYSYVNGSNEVVGRSIEIAGTKVFYATVRKGNEFGFEANIADEISITGKGTDKGDILNGKYQLNAGKKTLMEVEFVDFNTAKLEDGYINGTIRIFPSSELLDETLDDSVASGFALANFGLEFKFETSEKKSKIAINAINSDKVLLGINITGTVGKATDIKKPADKDVIDVTDYTALSEYLEGLNFDKVISNLKKSSVPDEYVDAIESLVSSLQSGALFGGGYDYDEDYDYAFEDEEDYEYDDEYEYDFNF